MLTDIKNRTAHIFLTIYNSDKLTLDEKFDFFSFVDELAKLAQKCNVEEISKETFKNDLLKMIK